VKNRHYQGFTLIELLVVIAIIAILAAILFPVFARAREKARQTTCTSNQRQIATTIQMYAQDHEETLPETSNVWKATAIDPGVLICPTQGKSNQPGYFFNGGANNFHLAGKSIGEIDDPAAALLTCDAMIGLNTVPDGWESKTGLTMMAGHNTSELINCCHSGQVIVSFVDGHVASLSAAAAETAFYVSGVTMPAYTTATGGVQQDDANQMASPQAHYMATYVPGSL
jgi:prepilin-type N-terminal cleavage/methylation domain-containing protein/prepilin-type processing-associated H-X9-DG protein